MHRCEKCGYEAAESESPDFGLAGMGEGEDSELNAKDSVLAELMELMEGRLGEKLAKKKPAAMSLEVLSAKPKKDEDDEEGYL